MPAIHSLLLALTAGCGDKGSDSAGETDTDTDTDSDTDTDTDTDTDSDAEPEHYMDGTIHVTVTDATGKKNLCDTMVDITGEEFAGGCLFCDFELDIETSVASENGTGCDYTAYPLAHLLEGPVLDDLFLGWSSSFSGPYQTYDDVLWFGFSEKAYGFPGPYWYYAIGYKDGVYGATTYTDGIDWTRSYNSYANYAPTLYYCGAYPYPYSGTNYGGAYTGSGSLNCGDVTPYETWSFQGVDNGYAYISLDTVAKDTSFDPFFIVSTPDACVVGVGNESFACSYPPAAGLCPSVSIQTTSGETYTVLVEANSSCDAATGDYQISIDAGGDPSLQEVANGDFTPYLGHVTAEADTTITLE